MTVSTKIILEPYGLVRISGEVEKDTSCDPATEGCVSNPFDVRHLRVVVIADGEVLQGTKTKNGKQYQVCGLDQFQVDKCNEVLIDRYIDEMEGEADYRIDEAIERSREYNQNQYA